MTKQKEHPNQEQYHIAAADSYVTAVEDARHVWAEITDNTIGIEQFKQTVEILTRELIEAKRMRLAALDRTGGRTHIDDSPPRPE